MPAEDHPQLKEVLDYLKANQDCAIVHSEFEREVAIEFDREANWYVQTVLKQPPDAAAKKKLKSAGLKTTVREIYPQFGPQRGKTVQVVTVAGDFKSPETAARAALSMFETLWQVPATESFWVTARRPDDRWEPDRPSARPPAKD